MLYMWTGEVTADRQGYRVLGTGSKGTFQLPRFMAEDGSATMLLRVYAMNANGKVYMVSKGYDLKP